MNTIYVRTIVLFLCITQSMWSAQPSGRVPQGRIGIIKYCESICLQLVRSTDHVPYATYIADHVFKSLIAYQKTEHVLTANDIARALRSAHRAYRRE